jgi:hypothetical protein
VVAGEHIVPATTTPRWSRQVAPEPSMKVASMTEMQRRK